MSDNFKFRAISKITEMFVFGYYDYDQHLDQHFIRLNGVIHDVYSDTVTEFTGFTDKNGIEIYVGDFIEFIYCPKTLNQTIKGMVSRDDWKNYVIADGKALYHFENSKKGSVIGNFYQNAEWLQAVALR